MYYVQHYADGEWQSFGVDNSPWQFLTFEDAKAELFEAKNDDHSLKLRILEVNAAGWGWSTKFVPPSRTKIDSPMGEGKTEMAEAIKALFDEARAHG